MIEVNNYKGFSLFNDIEDKTLRLRNRACILANIAETNVRNKLISPKGAALVLGYVSRILPEDRGDLTNRFKEVMIERGFKLV